MNRRPTVVVLDYGSGNVRSALRALEHAGADANLTAEPEAVRTADGLVVPGVGAFATCMNGLNAVNGPSLVEERVSSGRPTLGICVGMQVLFDTGEEHGVTSRGIGIWQGTVEQLKAPTLPHMGWNAVSASSSSVLFRGIEESRFYFVHSYAALRWIGAHGPARKPPSLTWSEHGDRFLAAVEDGALTATQFHPEKSGGAGAKLLSSWLQTL